MWLEFDHLYVSPQGLGGCWAWLETFACVAALFIVQEQKQSLYGSDCPTLYIEGEGGNPYF